MREKQDGQNQQREEHPSSVGDELDTSAFESDLRATLDWLTEGSGPDPDLGECPEAESVISHVRGERQPGLSEHLKDCRKCGELVSYLRQRDHIYQRQREYFLKQVDSEDRDQSRFSSIGKVLLQAFRPFEFVLQKGTLAIVSVVFVVAAIAVWQLPGLVTTYRASPRGVSLHAENLLASRKVEADYGRIQESSAADPSSAEKVIDDLRDPTRKGGMVTTEKMNLVLASVQAKKTEAPEKSGDWDRIENQLRVYALLNSYGQLRSEKQTGAPLWKDFIGGSEVDGNAMILVSREVPYDLETYKLLEKSRQGLMGVNGITLVTPSNKRIPVTTNLAIRLEEQRQPLESQSMGAAVSVSSTSVARPAESGARTINILDKPQPQYTEEARTLKLEGDVVLDVVFLADSKVEVNRVISGLGHGLDEKAVEAAQSIKFEPARANGKPVDFPARLRIEFRLKD
jgi:TonB family protein